MEKEEEEDLGVTWHWREGNVCLLLGLWGHSKPEKLVLSRLEHGHFTYDRLWHAQQLEEEMF